MLSKHVLGTIPARFLLKVSAQGPSPLPDLSWRNILSNSTKKALIAQDLSNLSLSTTVGAIQNYPNF